MAQTVAPKPFLWSGNQAVSPDQVKDYRNAANALMSRRPATPQNAWEGIGAVASALSERAWRDEADKAEKEGGASRKAVLDALLANPDPSTTDIAGALGNDWVSSDPGSSAVIQALMQQENQQQDWGRQDALRADDRAYDAPLREQQLRAGQAQLDAAPLDAQYKQAQIDALANKSEAPIIVPKGSNIYDANTRQYVTPTMPGGAAAMADPKAEGDLRAEYNGINTVRDFGLQTQAYQRVLDSAKDPSPAGDLALIFNYMKVLDPGSTVREGEFATAQNSGSLPEQIMSQYNKVLSGERLVPEIRKDFVNRAGQLFQGAARLQQGTNDRYDSLATQYGFDPNRITADVPQIGILDPGFKLDEYLTPQGAQTKPIPLTKENADAEFNALPSGAYFVAPDGSTRQKP